MKKLIILVVLAGSLMIPATAQASSQQRSGTFHSPICFYWNFKEYRNGLFFGGELWKIHQRITWCNDGGNHFNGKPQRTYGHREGSTWNFGGWDQVYAAHKRSPNRWEFRIAATMVGNASGIFNEHNYPFIRMTVYPQIGQSTWASSCGCKGTIGVQSGVISR